SAVKIKGVDCQTGRDGSGFVVDGGLVVTNAHVVAGVEHPVVVSSNGQSFDARVVAFDSRRDVAVLRAPGLAVPAFAFGSADKGEEPTVAFAMTTRPIRDVLAAARQSLAVNADYTEGTWPCLVSSPSGSAASSSAVRPPVARPA